MALIDTLNVVNGFLSIRCALSPRSPTRRSFPIINCLTALFRARSRNAQRYEEAGRHVLDALTLQNSDAVGDPRGGVTSDALWDSLESVCGKMGRADLMGACSQRDLDSESEVTMRRAGG